MTKRCLLFLLSSFFWMLPTVVTPRVYAAPVPATATATPKAAANAQLEELKDRLATKVAELRDIVRKAVTGSVKTISISSATIETNTKDVKIELADDITVTQILSGKRTTLTIDDVTKDDRVTIFGSYDATLDLLKAKLIFIESAKEFERVSGTITAIDQKTFTLTVQTPEKRMVTVDIEKVTKISLWNKTDGIGKGGFTKIVVGDTVHLVGTPVPKKENRISAIRVLDIGNLSGIAPTPTQSVVASDSATPKTTAKPTP